MDGALYASMNVLDVVENLSRVFLSEWPLILWWVMRVYIVWMKGKKVTFKILQAESFVGTS